MKYHKQQHIYDPTKDERGSCYPTVLACLLDLELDKVPNFHLFYFTDEEENRIKKFYLDKHCNGNYDTAEEYQKQNYTNNVSKSAILWYECLDYFLLSRGYVESKIMKEDYKDWLTKNPDTPYMVTGKSSRGVLHVVIYINDKMVHDPHPSNDGLLELVEEPYSFLRKFETNQ